jgi:phage terminase large subunit-like protein
VPTSATTTTTKPRSKARSSRAGKPASPPPARKTRGFHVIEWIETHCVFTNGEWIGRPFRLLPWQKRLVLELFELRDNGLRRYRWALIGVPKKNGKTELAAALGLYFLLGDGEPSPLVVCAAASEDQADLVFGAAKRMAELSPTLSRVVSTFEREILVPSSPGATLKRVAAVSGTNDGQNIHAVICDELHEWVGKKGEDVWNVLTNGTGARRQPMVLQITTAGHDKDTVLGEQFDYCEKVRNGEVEDGRYYFFWQQAAEGADHRRPETWRIANPSYGVTVREEFFEDQLKKPEAVFRRYFLNQWTETEETWLPSGAWAGCRSDLTLDPELPLYVAIDVGIRHDSAAVTAVQKRGQRYVTRAWIWENPYPRGTARHDAWQFSIAIVENRCRELFEQFQVPAPSGEEGPMGPGPAFFYDPHFFVRSAQLLEGDGLTMLEFPQSDPRMIPASQGLYELIVTHAVAHDGDPALARHIKAVIADEKPRGWRMSKPRGSGRKIDAAIAEAMATDRCRFYLAQPDDGPSMYEEQGVDFA